MRTLLFLLLISLAATGAAWHWRAELKLPAAAASATAIAAPAGLRKCTAGARTVYTDGVCPAGLREQPVEGALTVVPGGVPARPADAAASGLPNARTLLLPTGGPDLKAQRMDAVIGK